MDADLKKPEPQSTPGSDGVPDRPKGPDQETPQCIGGDLPDLSRAVSIGLGGIVENWLASPGFAQQYCGPEHSGHAD
jgi:hypothetical protein